MPITEITYQPEGAIHSAYRPIVFRCKAVSGLFGVFAAPVAYCDVYVNSVYYKSLSKTQPYSETSPEFEFDIQDVMQELMDYEIPAADGSKVETFYGGVKNVFVRFRNAKIDANGFTVSEQVSPTMATSSSPSQAGAGTQSASIVVVNALVQHEESMSLTALLNSYKTGAWDVNSYPLTRRPKDHILGLKDSSHFPILTDKTVTTLCLVYTTHFSTSTFCVEADVVDHADDSGGGSGPGPGPGPSDGSPSLVFIQWADSFSNEDRICTTGTCPITIAVDKTDPDNDIVSTEVLKSTDGGATWTTFIADLGAATSFTDSISVSGNRWYKVKVTDAEAHSVQSNILKYSISTPVRPTYNFWFRATHPEGHAGVDKVVYKDIYGNEQEQLLQRSYQDENGFYPAPCTLVVANTIVTTFGAVTCIP